VAGHRGMVGAAIVRRLEARGYTNVMMLGPDEVDLRRQQLVEDYFCGRSFDQVYLAAARVGGILANSMRPGEFIYDNLMIAANVIYSCHMAGVERLLYLGSSCIYPRLALQPMTESALLTGSLEATNEPYAVAKIAGLKPCESYNRQYGHDFRSVMPTNLYGPHDNFHATDSHVVPALIRRFHEAKVGNEPSVVVWGSGEPMRGGVYAR
jgi:GDP-L-fucose synthase